MPPTTFDFKSKLPDKILITREGNKVEVDTASHLSGKVIGLYFSAHWCPPCRGFTPKLAETYNKVVGAGKSFEIVFVSSDKEQGAFDEYFGEQPWAALPYADRDTKNALSKYFKVSGIPTFVLVDESGNVISTDGRSAVSSDPEGLAFPWRPKPLKDILAGVEAFQRSDGSKVTHAELEGKTIGIYFSAHWCPPCRGFTPKLAENYKKLLEAEKPFEIIFASSDRDEEAFQEYLGEMPWCAVPFKDRKAKEELSEYFGVSGIPSLAIVDGTPDRAVITKNGRAPFSGTGEECVDAFPFEPKAYNDVNKDQEGLNEETCMVLLTDSMSEADRKVAVDALAKVAQARKEKGDEMCFFYAGGEEGIVERVRELTNQEGTGPVVVMLDIPDNGGYYISPTGASMTQADLEAFADNYKSGKREQMS